MSTHIVTVWHYNADSLLQQPENNELPHKKPSVMAISGQNHGVVGKDGIAIFLVLFALVIRDDGGEVAGSVEVDIAVHLLAIELSKISGVLLRNVPIAVELANHRTILCLGSLTKFHEHGAAGLVAALIHGSQQANIGR